MPFHPILDRRLLFVSGKGGVGKTVTTAALALFAFRRRKRVLVVELSPYGRLRELLGGPEPTPEPAEIQPHLELVRIEPRRALEDFLQGILPIRALRQRLLQSHSFSILTAAAPGIEEFLALAKIAEFEAMRIGVRRRPRYDLVIVDAPATGHSLALLSTAKTLMEMLPIGPIGKTAEGVNRVLADPRRSAAVIVTIPEEMAVNETIEISSALSRSGALAVGPVIANAVWPDRFNAEEARWLMSSGLDGADALIAAGRYHVEKRRRTEEQLARLRAELRVEPVELPFVVNETLDRPHLRRLAAALDAAYSPPGVPDA
ncbi:MAG TPA: ArsA family ATPase [Candidatus Binatia bacterium]|nr:ArsA family ATPase [Candidatus Binatia bacterium]